MTYEDTTQGDKEVSTAQLKAENTVKAEDTVPSGTVILAQEASAEQLKEEAQVLTHTHTHTHTHTLYVHTHARTHIHTHTHTHAHTHTHTHAHDTCRLRNSLARQV